MQYTELSVLVVGIRTWDVPRLQCGLLPRSYTPFKKSLAVGSCFLLSNTAIMKSVLKDNFETLGLKNEVFQRKWRHRIQSPNSYISALHPPFFLYRPPQRYRPSVIRGLIKTQANLFIHQIVNRTRAGGRLCCFLRWNLYWKQICISRVSGSWLLPASGSRPSLGSWSKQKDTLFFER